MGHLISHDKGYAPCIAGPSTCSELNAVHPGGDSIQKPCCSAYTASCRICNVNIASGCPTLDDSLDQVSCCKSPTRSPKRRACKIAAGSKMSWWTVYNPAAVYNPAGSRLWIQIGHTACYMHSVPPNHHLQKSCQHVTALLAPLHAQLSHQQCHIYAACLQPVDAPPMGYPSALITRAGKALLHVNTNIAAIHVTKPHAMSPPVTPPHRPFLAR